VVADVVAGTEVRVRVVIESAPANTAGVLRIRSELIVDACVAQRVLTLALIVVDRLARIRVAYKFRVEIARMIRRFSAEKMKSFIVKTSSRNSDSWKSRMPPV